MANGHGGRRAGSGRKRKRTFYEAESPVKVAERKILTRLPELVDVALELAIDKHNPKMVAYCIDRLLGKPIERQESGAAGTFLQGYEIRLVRVNDRDDDATAAAS